MSFLFVDKIVELVEGEYIKGIKHISFDDPYLAQDKDKQLYFPPSLIGETLGQLAAWNAMSYLDFQYRPVAGIASGAKMLHKVKPGDTLVLESFINKLDEDAVEYHSEAKVNSTTVFRLESALGPMLPMEDFIAKDEVINHFHQLTQELGKAQSCDSLTQIDVSHWLGRSEVCANTHLDFDAVTEMQPGESLKAIKLVNRAAPYFADHFPRKPVLPMTVLLEAKMRLAAYFIEASQLGESISHCEIKRAKMSEFVYPGSVLNCHLKVKSASPEQIVISFRSEVANKRVCIAEARFFS